MPSILNLKFKGNKSFVAFSNLNDTEALTKTWKVCTKVASFLEQGQRLENLSWRLWHLQNLMVDTDNAKSKREFRKLSKCMGDKLDKEKGRSIEELEAPDFKRNHSVEMIRQRAAEKERLREANQVNPGTLQRMQFTFSVDQPVPAPTTTNVKKPGADSSKRTRAATRAVQETRSEQPQQFSPEDTVMANEQGNDKDPPSKTGSAYAANAQESLSLRFPSLFSNDFGPTALLFPTPTLTNPMNYGEGLNPSHNTNNDSFSVVRPTIELPLDELLHNMDSADSADAWASFNSNSSLCNPLDASPTPSLSELDQDVAMAPVTVTHHTPVPTSPTSIKRPAASMEDESSNDSDDEFSEADATVPVAIRPIKKHTRSASKSFSQGNAVASTSTAVSVPPLSQTVKEVLPETVAPSRVNELFSNPSARANGRPTLTVRTQATPTTRSSGPGATATTLTTTSLRGSSGNSAPGGVKAECSNCGATHTPLWRRGLNDELNCNACGLYCKLHKRPRPKSMRNSHGAEGRTQAQPRQETVDVMAQCYNCHTTATPLWRKDDEGKTVCNACGLYYKLHGSARPISMKSDVIRKRSRHDARRGNSIEDTPSASPGVSRRTSPVPELGQPTLAPDTSTGTTYDYSEEMDFRSHNSELMNALGTQDPSGGNLFSNPFSFQFPGPYHPDYLVQMYTTPQDAMPFSNIDSTSEADPATSPRSTKRRRMSTDSASEPPSSAVSFSSYNDGYSSASSATSHSQRSSMDFPFSSNSAAGPALRGSGNTFWHPPMLPQAEDHHSPQLFQQAMHTSATTTTATSASPNGSPNGSSNQGSCSDNSSNSNDESPMDYLHPPMLPQDEELFSTFLHPPMALPEDASLAGHMPHPPMHYDYQQSFEHDTSMRVY